jgi:hypothetical protein
VCEDRLVDALGFEVSIERPEVQRWAALQARRHRNLLARQAGVELMLCERCGVEYEPTGVAQRFCSRECRWKAQKERQRTRADDEANAAITEWVVTDQCFDLPALADDDRALFPAL